MTARKTDEVVFGYRPPSSRGGMMSSGDEPEQDDLITDEDGPTYSEARAVRVTLRQLKRIIREAMASPER